VVTGGVYIALGSNLGDRARHLRDALRELAAGGDVTVQRCSSFHDTAPVGGPPDQPRYLNAVAELDTALSPQQLLVRLQAVELLHSRKRTVVNGPRTLDLDLLLYRDAVIQESNLTVPHPRMWQRDFVLQPLAEICDLARLQAARSVAASP